MTGREDLLLHLRTMLLLQVGGRGRGMPRTRVEGRGQAVGRRRGQTMGVKGGGDRKPSRTSSIITLPHNMLACSLLSLIGSYLWWWGATRS